MTDTNKHIPEVVKNLTDSVDLSNACREFYQARRKAAENVKEKLASLGRRQKNNVTSIDTAISKLRIEMVSLMEKDLSLMKQLLNLNETIEDLKWQKRTSFIHLPEDSSCDLGESDWSVSETDMYESESDVESRTQKQCITCFHVTMRNHETVEATNETTTIKVTKSNNDIENDQIEMLRPPGTKIHRLSISFETRKFLDLPSELDEFLNGTCCQSDEENSSDSGIHESEFWPEMHADV